MSRSARSLLLIAASWGLALAPESLLAQRPTNIHVVTDSVTAGVYLLGVTSDQGPVLAQVTVFSTGAGALLIDTHAGQAAPLLQATLDGLGLPPITTAINTHWHPDHNNGNAAWRAKGVTVVAHENTRALLAHPQVATGLTGPGTEFRAPAVAPEGLPDLTFSDSLSLYVGEEMVRVFHPGPSHTGGDAVVWIPSRGVLHLGDLYWPGSFP